MQKHKRASETPNEAATSGSKAERGAARGNDGDRRGQRAELLPSDSNDAADISPRIAFLAYN